MAQIMLNIPDDKAPRILDAFAATYGWTPEMGVTKTVFAKQQLVNFIKNTVKESEGNYQASQVRNTVNTDIDTITIT